MNHKEIGKLYQYTPVLMKSNLLSLFEKKFNRKLSDDTYANILKGWENKIVYIMTYDGRNSEIYKVDSGLWNLYPEYIKELITPENYPEYFL